MSQGWLLVIIIFVCLFFFLLILEHSFDDLVMKEVVQKSWQIVSSKLVLESEVSVSPDDKEAKAKERFRSFLIRALNPVA